MMAVVMVDDDDDDNSAADDDNNNGDEIGLSSYDFMESYEMQSITVSVSAQL
jgi:hypothetical protein